MRAWRRSWGMAMMAVVAAVAAGCGGPSDEERVRATLDRFASATADKDYGTLCRKTLARKLVEQVESVGIPCELALRTGLEDVERPRLAVADVKVDGGVALAQVRSGAVGQAASEDVVRLVRERAGWRIASLAVNGPPEPEGPAAEALQVGAPTHGH